MEQRPRKRPTQVLVFGSERLLETAHAAAAVEGLPPLEVRRTDDARGGPGGIDVVLADCDIGRVAVRATTGKRRPTVAQVLVGVPVSHDAMADAPHEEIVRLPADATPREVRLACVLAADAVRWRRRLDRRSQKEKRLRRLSFADPLTGVGNLRAWKARLAAACRRVRDDGAAVCLALFDVDRFKNVNDAHGHAAGDDVLRGVASRLSAGVREEDFVARLGGDEFGLILVNLGAEHADKSVERVRQELCCAYPTATGETIDVTASAGWCVIVAGDAPDAAVERADRALRSAKCLGRNQTHAAETAKIATEDGERSA